MDAYEILKLESDCVQEEPVYCSAVCPVHLDVRAVLYQVQRGNFREAEKIYSKKVLFPGIISRICEEPCKNSCIRKLIDQSVSIRLLEKACVDFSSKSGDKKKYSIIKKKRRIAVIGGGLSGLSCALDLSNKGYEITVYEKTEKLGGKLWEMSPDILPRQVIVDEMAMLEDAGMDIRVNCRIKNLNELDQEAVYIATGKNGDTFDLKQENGTLVFDAVSLESSREGVFVGGSLVSRQQADLVIENVAQGIQAARSIERYLQNASLTVGRENEGVQSTRLHTVIRNIARKEAVSLAPEKDSYSESEAIEESYRCIQCECMECVKACDFLSFYHNTPRRYLRDISKTIISRQEIRGKMIASRFINSCSLCGQCAEICPNGLDMGRVCHDARQTMVNSDTMPPAFYDFWLRDLQFSNKDSIRLIKHQSGCHESRFLFFPGCQTGASMPDYAAAMYRLLIKHLNGGVGLALLCCGAPADWSGQKKLHEQQLSIILTAWKELGKPKLIVACPTCQKMLMRYLPDLPVKSIWSLLDENEGWLQQKNGNGASIALYDPCSSRYDKGLQKSVRHLLKKLDYKVEELPLNGKYAQCCSFGGLISTVNPELSAKIIEHRINASPLTYATYCTNCRDDFARHGKPVLYLMDLLTESQMDVSMLRKPPSYSERRDNRKLLKKKMLEEFWGEEMNNDKQAYEEINIIISEELKQKLDLEFILLEEIKQVVHHAETTGFKVIDKRSGSFTAHLQVGIITYWAEYFSESDGYHIMNAYCHRMQIVEEVKIQ